MDFVYVLLFVIAAAIALALYLAYIAASGLLAAAVAVAAYGLALPARPGRRQSGDGSPAA